MPSEESQTPPAPPRKCPGAAALASRKRAVPSAVARPGSMKRESLLLCAARINRTAGPRANLARGRAVDMDQGGACQLARTLRSIPGTFARSQAKEGCDVPSLRHPATPRLIPHRVRSAAPQRGTTWERNECTVQAVVEHRLSRRAGRDRGGARRRAGRGSDDLRTQSVLHATGGPGRSAGAVRSPAPRRRRGDRLPLLPLPGGEVPFRRRASDLGLPQLPRADLEQEPEARASARELL